MIQGRRPTEKTRGFPGDFCENFHDFDENALKSYFIFCVFQTLNTLHHELNDVGLGCHKDAIGLPDALGYQVMQKEYFQGNCDRKRASPHKMFRNSYVLKGNDDKCSL